MPSLAIADHAERHAGHDAPWCTSTGTIESSRATFEDSDMWVVTATLEPGAEIRWDDVHGDEGIYVVSGAVEVEEPGGAPTRCGPRSVVVVESSAPATLRAVERTQLVHDGSNATEAYGDGMLSRPFASQHGVHVISPEDAATVVHTKDDGTENRTAYYADGVCRTCRIALFTNSSNARLVAPSHFHDQDEIIHVTKGELRFGRFTVPEGSSIFVPAGNRYSFRTTDEWEFLNYRQCVGNFIGRPGGEPLLETYGAGTRRRASGQPLPEPDPALL